MIVSEGNIPVSPSSAPRPRVRFDAINEAWWFLQRKMGTWIVAMLLGGIVFCLIAYPPFLLFQVVTTGRVDADAMNKDMERFPVAAALLIGPFFVMAFTYLLGGFFRLAIRQVRGERIGPGDILLDRKTILPLFVAGLLAGTAMQLASSIPVAFAGFVLYSSAGSSAAGILVLLAGLLGCIYLSGMVAGLLMFTFPLIVDQRMGPLQAMRWSVKALKGQALWLPLFLGCVGVMMNLGYLLCCVGSFLTYPLFPLSLAVVYRDYFLGRPIAPPYPYAPSPGWYPPYFTLPRPVVAYPATTPLAGEAPVAPSDNTSMDFVLRGTESEDRAE